MTFYEYKKKVNEILNESEYNYKTFKQVEKDLDKLTKKVKAAVKKDRDLMGNKIMSNDLDSVKVVIGREVYSQAKVPRNGGPTRGRKNYGKTKPVVQIVFTDTFYNMPETRAAYTFFKVKDFNNWMELHIK